MPAHGERSHASHTEQLGHNGAAATAACTLRSRELWEWFPSHAWFINVPRPVCASQVGAKVPQHRECPWGRRSLRQAQSQRCPLDATSLAQSRLRAGSGQSRGRAGGRMGWITSSWPVWVGLHPCSTP